MSKTICIVLILFKSLALFAMNITHSLPEDKVLLGLLEKFYSAVESVKDDSNKLQFLLRADTKDNPVKELSTYLIKEIEKNEWCAELKTEASIYRYQVVKNYSDVDTELLTITLLSRMLHSQKLLNYLGPVLVAYENILVTLAGKNFAKNKALSFFIFSILGKILIPYLSDFPLMPKSIKLILRMIDSGEFQEHNSFLKQENLGKSAFRILGNLAKKLGL
jgi:hypothetical protein